MNESRFTLTEVDAALLSGLDPANPRSYNRIYCFDATTSHDAFHSRMLTKITRLQEFVEWMEEKGVDVHLIHVFFTDPEERSTTQSIRHSDDEKNHTIALPLRPLVKPVMERTAADLGLKAA